MSSLTPPPIPPASSPGEPLSPALIERVLIHGDLASLTTPQKLSYLKAVCESVGLNPLTRPFEYIKLPDGRLVLYAKREATEQLRFKYGISIDPKSFTREVIEGCYVVTVCATTPDGRTDMGTGAVAIDTLKGQQRANAMMAAETKAKRRATLSLCGLGTLDESEVSSIPGASVLALPPPERGLPDPHGDDADRPAPEAPPEDASLPLPDDGALRVISIEKLDTKNPRVKKYRIGFSDGRVATTINSKLATDTKTCLDLQTPVRIETAESQWGLDLLSLWPDDRGADGPF